MDIKLYSKTLLNRRISKAIQQLSWNLNQIEQKYDIDDMTEEDLISLNEFYDNLFKELVEIYKQVKKLDI